MAKSGELVPIDVMPGVEPITDKTAVATPHFTFTDKVRFRDGKPQKLGGWESIQFDYDEEIQGYGRSIYSEFINGKYYIVIGTNEKLYSVIGSRLSNITPLKATSEAAPDSLSTQYDTLANNPLSAVSGSNFVTVSDTDAARFVAGDTVYLSGATTFAGIPFGDLAGDFLIRSVGVNVYTIYVATAATSTASGGGASVVRTSGLINVDSIGHGNANGDRVKIEDATDTGGILAAEINTEFSIRNVVTDSFDVMTIGEATSSVTAGGGASTIYYEEIPIGAVNETNVQGYGAGFYGAGLYGTALTSSSSRSYPRIWFSDRYANTIITTPGNQGGLYQWGGTVELAPELIANAPTTINYAFVSNNILVTFGAGGIENRIFSSDQNDIEEWSSSSTNQVFDDDIEGVGRLTSHVAVQDYNLIFTEFETHKMRYIGLPFVWEITPVDESIGIIAPMARCSVKGMGFWMGSENFYMFRGGSVEIIPSNTEKQSTCLQYVFDDLNWGQKSKFFAWYNKEFNEVWFHYASSNSSECDRVVRVDLLEFTWSLDTFDRTAAEYPNTKLVNPRLINIGTLYQHELGHNADGEPMEWVLRGNKKWYGTDTINTLRVIPDSIQNGNISFTASGFRYPQSQTSMYDNSYTVTPTTEYVSIVNNGRYNQYEWSGDSLDQFWEMGQWFEELEKGPRE